MKKDESLMKQYLKRKQDLVKEKEKQTRFINDMRHVSFYFNSIERMAPGTAKHQIAATKNGDSKT